MPNGVWIYLRGCHIARALKSAPSGSPRYDVGKEHHRHPQSAIWSLKSSHSKDFEEYSLMNIHRKTRKSLEPQHYSPDIVYLYGLCIKHDQRVICILDNRNFLTIWMGLEAWNQAQALSPKSHSSKGFCYYDKQQRQQRVSLTNCLVSSWNHDSIFCSHSSLAANNFLCTCMYATFYVSINKLWYNHLCRAAYIHTNMKIGYVGCVWFKLKLISWKVEITSCKFRGDEVAGIMK